VRIEDFEPVACEYKRGPSYLFTEQDGAAFEDACQRWQPSASPSNYAVGYFRSHTREGFSLDTEDVELMDNFFSNASHVALLIKPYATKVSVAGLFARQHGVFPNETPLEFPLRRRELTGEEPPPRRSLMERRPRGRQRAPAPLFDESPKAEMAAAPLERMPPPEPAYATTTTAKSRMRSGWVWIPLSFIFLLLGVALGFQAALTMGTGTAAGAAQDYSLSLSAIHNDDNLTVRWGRQSPAIRSARRGVLEIEDGGYTKPVELDAAQLQNGTLIYRNSSDAVRFRLTVFANERVSITETLAWKK
jgi:hypothetical protein